jgi:chemotaxis protein methyltransferase CheR
LEVSIYLWISANNLTKKEWQIIASHLTVGETYFFREASSLKLFTQKIIPELISKRADNSKKIQIWCAGCSSGEEPYTLAMLIRENFPCFNNWDISILATDINLNSINKALDGQYTQWSFRETKPEIKHKYFTHKNNLWTVSPEIKKMVDFSYLNLAENNFPSAQTKTENIDVIFCRNVLMYFSLENIPEVAERLYSSLTEGGYLITSQVELNDAYFPKFAKSNYENAFYYRKSPKTIPDTSKLQLSHVGIFNFETNKVKKIKKNLPDTQIAHIKKSILKESAATKQVYLSVKSNIEEANDSANIGDYVKALEYLDQIIAANAADEDIYYLYGTILYELNRPEEAISKLKKGLYHNPHHLFSHVMLGNFQRLG